MVHKSLWLMLACLAFLTGRTLADETRLALIIDQTNYQNTSELSRVGQAGYEGDLIETALRDTGFRITRVSDRTKSQLIEALDDFRIRLELAGPEAVGFVYYTGHGAQHPGTRNSYLLGIDARLRAASDLASYGIDLEAQRDGFAATGAKAVFLVFDACRNVATGSGFKANVKGMSRIEADADMLIAYSTDLDDVAQEGIYAPILAEEIRRQGQPAETLFANVQKRVAQQTGFRQKPWFNPRLYKPVCFAGCQAQAMAAAPILTSDEGAALAQAISVNTLAAYTAFKDRFPNSTNLAFVSAKIAELTPRPVVAQSTRKAGDAFQDPLAGGGKGPEMVVIPAGSFTMGSPSNEAGRFDNEGPQRTVRIGYALAVGKYEVTWTDWEACVDDGSCPAANDDKFGQGRRPVTYVSWKDAQTYVSWLSSKTGETYRLLSEAEWEYAARAGTTGRFSNNGGDSQVCEIGNGAKGSSNGSYPNTACQDRYINKTAPAGSFAPNAFGLYDMHGNVWEWVEDCYEAGYAAEPSDGSAYTKSSCRKRVIRGGSWRNKPQYLRSAHRGWTTPGNQNVNIGFRVARTL